jgi:WhiB family redox-sensing transcriptional regulator
LTTPPGDLPAPPPLVVPGEWAGEALCAQIGADLWFSGKGESSEPAKQVCRACPVREECLEYALAAGEWRYGVWGGMSPRERRAERDRRAAAAARRRAA